MWNAKGNRGTTPMRSGVPGADPPSNSSEEIDPLRIGSPLIAINRASIRWATALLVKRRVVAAFADWTSSRNSGSERIGISSGSCVDQLEAETLLEGDSQEPERLGAVGRMLAGGQGVDAGDLVGHLGLMVEAEALAGIREGRLAPAESRQQDAAAGAERADNRGGT